MTLPARIAAALTVSLALALAPTAAFAAGDGGVQSWTDVPTEVTKQQTVWQPTRTLGISLHSTTDITFQSCSKPSGYIVSALYSDATAVKEAPGFYISENPGCADTGYTWYGKVRTFPTKYGSFTVFAQCGWDAAKGRPVPGYDGGNCSAADVKSKGGLVIYDQTKKTKAKKTVRTTIESDGLSYAQLLTIARGLKPLY